MKNKLKKMLATLLVMAVCVSTVSVDAFAENTNGKSQVNVIAADFSESVSGGDVSGGDASQGDTGNSSWDGVTTESVYVADNYTVTFRLDSFWDGGYNAAIEIENTGVVGIENWYLSFDYEHAISNIWNAQIDSFEENTYVVKNNAWNADIAVGSTVSFGFSVNESFEGFPEKYLLLTSSVETEEDDYSVEYRLGNDWGSGFSATIVITNNTDQTLEDWILEFDYARNITNIWNGVIESHEDGHYVIKNAGYNANIGAHQSVYIGFNGDGGQMSDVPSGFLLIQMGVNACEELSVTMNKSEKMYEYEGKEGYVVVSKSDEFTGGISLDDSRIKAVEVSVIAGLTKVPQNEVIYQNGEWSLAEPQLLIGDNIFTIIVYSKSGLKAEYSVHIWNTSEDNMNLLAVDMNDNDEDGLLNYQELQYGTNMNAADTDEDGFTDIDEIFLLNTDPLTYNADEDFDKDGLFNKEELVFNTNIYDEDTDKDDLTDYEEVHQYGTEPKNPDTDEDGIKDAVEIKWGMNPCVAENMNDDGTVQITYSQAEEGNVNATLSISLLPEQIGSLNVEKLGGEDVILSDKIPGYLGEGSAYDFTVDGTFTEAELTFKISEKLLADEEFEPAVYYYNEEEQLLEELEGAVWNNDTISVKLEHFSRYILLNKRVFDTVWEYELRFTEVENKNSSLDIVFVIDSSGSMTSNDRYGVRRTVTKNFIDRLTENDRAAVVDFDSYASVYSQFTSDKDQLYSAVDKINSSGGTNLSRGISAALSLFSSTTYEGEDKQKCIIMLTDGVGSYSTSYTTKAKDMGIVIYTIGLGSGVSTSVLTNMAEGTGGVYFHASQAEKLYDIFEDIIEVTDLYKDSDEDGLSDYYEKEMAAGNLRLGTGVSLEDIDYLKKHSDDDGLTDGEEITIGKVGKKIYVKLYSNPTEDDTDGDGLNDYIESNEIKTNIGTYNQENGKYKLSPLVADSDGDGSSDGEELGTFYSTLDYYRVNSNPFMAENYSVGNQAAVSYVLSYEINVPVFTKREYATGTMPNGESYTIYTFMDTTTFDFPQRKLVEVGDNWWKKEYYVLYATAGNNVRGGQYDEIYRRAELEDGRLKMVGGIVDVLWNAVAGSDGQVATDWLKLLEADGNSSDFLYFDNSEGDVISSEDWKSKIHFDERFELNCYYDTFLPITAYEAKQMGFRKLPQGEAKYHTPDGIDSETVKGASYKYVTSDGLEAIYEVLYDGSVETVSNDPKGTKMLPLQDYPKIGPTFNYSPNDSSTGILDFVPSKVSDASIAHYYFDMLPFYWWGGVPK